MEVAERYNDWGVTAFVLTYRLSPRYGENARVLDGKRAVQLVRARAAELKLDPNRVGYIGFSAGSNMARSVGGRLRSGRSECGRSDRPRQLAAGLSGAGVRRGARHAGRIAEGLSADVPGVGGGRYRARRSATRSSSWT